MIRGVRIALLIAVMLLVYLLWIGRSVDKADEDGTIPHLGR